MKNKILSLIVIVLLMSSLVVGSRNNYVIIDTPVTGFTGTIIQGNSTNNFVNSSSFSRSGSVVTLTLDRFGLGELSANFTDNSGGGGSGINISITSFVGSDLTGISGDVDRNLSVDEPIMIVVDNFVLLNTTDYLYTNGDLVLLNRLWDDQKIQIWTLTDGTLSITQFTGSDLTGSSSDSSRTLNHIDTPLFIIVDNFMLLRTTDYNYVGTTITYVNNIWDNQKIQIWS